MAIKLGRMMSYLDGLVLMKLHVLFIMGSCEIKFIISPIPQCLWTLKLDSMMTYFKQLPPMKLLIFGHFLETNFSKYGKVVIHRKGLPHLHSHSLCLREVTWQIKSIISPLSQCLWLQGVSSWCHTSKSSHP